MPQVRNMEQSERREHANSFIHKHVRVTVTHGWSSSEHAVTGRVICVAVPNVGVADMLVLQHDHPDPGKVYIHPRALSLATIKNIEEIA